MSGRWRFLADTETIKMFLQTTLFFRSFRKSQHSIVADLVTPKIHHPLTKNHNSPTLMWWGHCPPQQARSAEMPFSCNSSWLPATAWKVGNANQVQVTYIHKKKKKKNKRKKHVCTLGFCKTTRCYVRSCQSDTCRFESDGRDVLREALHICILTFVHVFCRCRKRNSMQSWSRYWVRKEVNLGSRPANWLHQRWTQSLQKNRE